MPAKTARSKNTQTARARAEYHKVPTKTPADDPGRYSKTPHEYGDVLIAPGPKGQTKLGGALQRDLVYWIERHTWGKNTGTPTKVVRPEWAKLSLAQLAKLCGSDRRTVARAIADLAERGIIEARDRTGCGKTVAKMYKLTPERWKKARYYEAKAMEIEADAELEEEDSETAAPEATDEPEREVSPGRVSKPQAVAVSPSKGAPVVSIRLVYRSVDLPFPVAFKAHPGRNGRVQISCRATALQRFANSSPSEIPATVEPTSVSTYSAFLTPFVLNVWGKALDNTLLNQIVTVANGAPVAVFENLVTAKFKASRKSHTTGLLVELAKDADRAWRKQQLINMADESARAARQRAQEAFEAEQNAPAAPEPEKCPTCKGTGQGKKVWRNVGGEYGPQPTKCEPCHGTGRKVAQ